MIECPTCTTAAELDLLIPAGTTHICVNCREAYLQRMKEGVSTDQSNEWVAIREEHIKHEASLRSVGMLYYIGAFFIIIGGIRVIAGTAVSVGSDSGNTSFMIGMVMVYLVLGVLFALIGRGFRQLRRWVRIPGGILSVLGLIQIPIGTIINSYVLYLMFSGKGNVVFSPEYQEIREAIPEVKYKTSMIVWVFLVILVVLL